MRAFGNPLGNPVQGGDGGQGTKVGDIVFAKKAPSASFIPIVNQRVYADQYPRLADVLQVRRENDGGEWLRPGGILPNVDPSNGQYFRPIFGGVSAGENLLVFYSGNGYVVAARGSSTTKGFSSLTSLSLVGGPRDIAGAISETGTVILIGLYQGQDYISGRVFRSTDALKTMSSLDFPESGLGPVNANRYSGPRPSVLSMGGGNWIIVNAAGDVFRSTDDGKNWVLVKTIEWTGINQSGTPFTSSAYGVGRAFAIGSRIWAIPNAYSQIDNLEIDTLVWSDDMFATYGRIRGKRSEYRRVYPAAVGQLGNDLVLLQQTQTPGEVSLGTVNGPIRGLYIPDANPANAPVFFDLPGSDGLAQQVTSSAVFSWDGIGYMGLPSLGFFRVEPRTFARAYLAPVLKQGNSGGWDGQSHFAKFSTFSLVWSLPGWTLPQWSAELLQAVPSDLARRYYQFSEASVVGAQRSDGKLPFMRAR